MYVHCTSMKLFWPNNQTDNVSSVYTSGRKCNFQKKGCEAPQVEQKNTLHKYHDHYPQFQPVNIIKTLKHITIIATTIPSFNLWISMDGSGLMATLRSLQQTYLAGGKMVKRYLLNSASRKVQAGWCKQIFQSENKKSLKAEEDTGKLLKAILPNRQTFWSRTGELGKAQPDNYNGQKAGRQYNQHHFHICH